MVTIAGHSLAQRNMPASAVPVALRTMAGIRSAEGGGKNLQSAPIEVALISLVTTRHFHHEFHLSDDALRVRTRDKKVPTDCKTA